MYKRFIKRFLDMVLSAIAMIILAIPMLMIAVIIKIDSPGPVLFKQERIGVHKGRFQCLKFRSMYTAAPADMPTHMLGSPEHWITRAGRILRKYSLDELPQLFCIFGGTMSLVGPRPALWNQDDLIAERDKYGANGIKPGLTGWAQVNGRDELEIPVKARLDGEYAEELNRGGFRAFFMDCKCVWKTVLSVLRHEGVVEGGTGAMEKKDAEEIAKEPALK